MGSVRGITEAFDISMQAERRVKAFGSAVPMRNPPVQVTVMPT